LTHHNFQGFSQKISGLKEEMKGKLTKNPELVEHGRERRTGELKHKEMEDDVRKLLYYEVEFT
jgi:hypothetical protein